MGRAIVHIPKVFLFDESLSNFDAKLHVQMRVEVKTMRHNLSITIGLCDYPRPAQGYDLGRRAGGD